ncbi:Xylulose kinase [subsurface metagenome]
MDCLLGIDIGTTGMKSALFSANGLLIDSDYITYPVTYPGEGRAEQNPEDWWNALAGTVRNIVSRNRSAVDIVSMSLSTQGGCLILLDENYSPLLSAVSWLDKRAHEVSGIVREGISEAELYRTCGWANVNSLNLPSIVWFREKRHDLFERTRYFASTADYINYRLTGKFSIDYTNLAMAMLLDLHKKDFSDKALHTAGITRDNVPEIVPSGTAIGTLRTDAAEELGLSGDVVLVSGAHDQYCASIGAGAVNAGDCVLSTGTAWVLLVTSDTLLFDINRVIHPCVHVLDSKYGLLTSVASGGNSLNWFQSTFRPGVSFEALSREAESVEAGCSGLLYIPENVTAHGCSSFTNIDTAQTINFFTRSVFEGVAFANKRHLEVFSENGIDINKIIMIGGGAGSSVWPQIVADVSGIPLLIPEQKEAACTGAAILAGVGCGIFNSVEEAVKRFAGEKYKIIQPDEKNTAVYENMYGEFVDLLKIL